MSGRWIVNEQVSLAWERRGLVARTSEYAEGFPIVAEFVPLLDVFAEPTDLNQGAQTFLARYDGAENAALVAGEVSQLVDRLTEEAILVRAESGARLVGGYFAQPALHVTLLSDYGRTVSYREVLAKHAPGKVVLEIGCGSGVLACFAAKAGAKHVYAIERAKILDVAMQIAEINGLSDRITFVPGDSRDVELPEKADIIFSEIIGSDPLIQGLVPTLRDAVDRLLTPAGQMIPRRLRASAVGIQSDGVRRRQYLSAHQIRSAEQLGTAYGLNLTPLSDAFRLQLDAEDRGFRSQESLGGPVLLWEAGPYDPVLTDEALVFELDLAAMPPEHRERLSLEMKVLRRGLINAVALYFTAEMDDELVMSTSPFGPQPAVAWGQLVQPVEERHVEAGETLRFEVLLDPRSRPTTISFAWT